jgi:hypothetical protein
MRRGIHPRRRLIAFVAWIIGGKSMLRRSYSLTILFVLLIVLGCSLASVAQEKPLLPKTVLQQDTLSLLRDEISGQRALNLATMLAGYPRIRTAEEFEGPLYEAGYLRDYLIKSGLEDVRVESLEKGDKTKNWWIPTEGELSLVQPEQRRLARLEDDPALVTRGSDDADVTAPLIYLDQRDFPKLGDTDVKGKIILTPEYASRFAPAFEKGALGVISFYDHANPIDYPDQVNYDMRLMKGKAQGKVFAFQISPRLGYELRDKMLQGMPLTVHARTRVALMPWKAETVFAVIKGTSPEKKGLMFTAHLFERLVKQGANDNVSGSVVIAEIARALNTLITEGKIPRPERNIYFLWSEEGISTMSFFRKYPEMAGKIFGDINMDMVGEQLSANQGTFKIEAPQYSRVFFLNSVIKSVADFVAQTNHGDHSNQGRPDFLWPIVERRGSRDAFRYKAGQFDGGSDHGVFNESDSGVSAVGFIVWPDHWYHTDEDTIDKMDSTQMKRVGFIATASALAVCGGDDAVLSRVVRTTYADGIDFAQHSMIEAADRVSALDADDSGAEFRSAVGTVREAFRMGRRALDGLHDFTATHMKAEAQLASAISGVDALEAPYIGEVQDQYEAAAKLAGFRPNVALTPSKDEAEIQQATLSKVKPVALGELLPYEGISKLAMGSGKGPNAYQALGSFRAVTELFLSADGKTPLSDIRSRLELEFHKPISVKDFNYAVDLMTSGDVLKKTQLAPTSPVVPKKKKG